MTPQHLLDLGHRERAARQKGVSWRNAHAGEREPLGADAVHVGMLIPMSGAAGLWGPSCLACATLATEEWNRAGGLRGRPIQLTVIDASDESESLETEVDDLLQNGGVAAMVGVAAIIKTFGRLERDATLSLGSAVGTTGTVYLSIPGRRTGVGKVHLTVQNRLVECLAVTAEDPLPTGSSVLVVDLEGNDTVVVVRNPILLNEVSNVGA